MTYIDPYEHMEDAWGLEANPFPGEAISGETDHYSQAVYPEEERDFRMKVVRGGLQGGRKMGFLWSMSPIGEDTGFGKTSMMRRLVQDINVDLGRTVQQQLGVKEHRQVSIAAAFAELNEQSRNGLYPVLFAATQSMAAGEPSLFDVAYDQIVSELGGNADPDDIVSFVADKQLEIAPSGQALRNDVIWAFAEGGRTAAELLAGVSDASRLRNGIQYFTAALYILAAAGVKKVFLMVDQMEDLGKKGALSAAKRRREIGRIRDLLEIEPYASMLHTSFTLHTGAAANLEADWEANRLPSFDPASSNSAAVTVLTGLKDDDQVRELLRIWMADKRLDGNEASIAPFTDDVLAELRLRGGGRPGKVLVAANELVQAGAQAALGQIDAAFAQQHFGGAAPLAGVSSGDVAADDDLDDLLA